MVLKLAIFISGRGSNMQALIENCPKDFVQPVVVFSDRADAAGLEIARKAGIAIETLSPKDFKDRKDFDKAVIEKLAPYKADLLCLAGFMRILSPFFIQHWPTPILNMHPSLLPKYKGLSPHQQALDANDTQSGCSVHLVTEELDGGHVLLQRNVAILDDDTEETLAARILAEEHIAYPAVVSQLAKALKNGKELRSALEFFEELGHL
jgi:phosphoribosylglycinamide formyltransferase-1